MLYARMLDNSFIKLPYKLRENSYPHPLVKADVVYLGSVAQLVRATGS